MRLYRFKHPFQAVRVDDILSNAAKATTEWPPWVFEAFQGMRLELKMNAVIWVDDNGQPQCIERDEVIIRDWRGGVSWCKVDVFERDYEAMPNEESQVSDKQFYKCIDDECCIYLVVADSLDHAKDVLRKSGCVFGPQEGDFDQATTLVWSEISGERIVIDGDGRPALLKDFNVGEWFCSEH